MNYNANLNRYQEMQYRRCGKSGIQLPEISLGLWHNFGGVDSFENSRSILRKAFDSGITHFDLANNYGPPPGSAEETMGQIIKKDFLPYRDELIISSKAGYYMWPGPYGDWGSKKYIVSSCEQSLKRLGIEYLDIFYSHRPDPNTPIEETMGALDYLVRSGKALYAGISNYDTEQTKAAVNALNELKTPCLIHQVKYSMLVRNPEDGLLNVLDQEGVGCIAFSPLAQGLLTDRYLGGIPIDSRASKPNTFLKKEQVSDDVIEKVKKLKQIASKIGITTTQLAIAWLLRDKRVTSVLIGVSKVEQLSECLKSIETKGLSQEILEEIEIILA